MDLLIGDPHNIPHPIRSIGKLIAALDRSLLGGELPASEARDPKRERKRGVLMVLIVLTSVIVISLAVMTAAYSISVYLGMAAEVALTCYALAQTSLRRESMKVYTALAAGDLEGARQAVSMIVGRDTKPLDEKGITRAAVETVAENLSDGVIAPMIYAAIGGPVLAMAYKAVNTMDSMTGYRNDRYMHFGTAAAKLDDAVNYLPSRISAMLIILAAAFRSDCDAGRSYRIWKRDRRNHKSPNAAQTESACAGALGIRLAGSNYYFGKLVEKPYIGDAVREIEYEDIKRSNSLMSIASWACMLLCLGIMVTIWVTTVR